MWKKPKPVISILSIVLIVEAESKIISDKRMTDHFNNSGPAEQRNEGSITGHWISLQAAHKFNDHYYSKVLICRHVHDWNASRIPGSTGQEEWWSVPKVTQRASVGKRGVYSTDFTQLILDSYHKRSVWSNG